MSIFLLAMGGEAKGDRTAAEILKIIFYIYLCQQWEKLTTSRQSKGKLILFRKQRNKIISSLFQLLEINNL